MATILVLGATGTVGSELVKQLSSSGQHIRGTVHSTTTAAFSKDKFKEVQFVRTDYNKPETIALALKDVDKLFLLTPVSPNATELISNIVTEAKKAGIRYIVRLSIMGADTKINIAHLCLHRQAEKIIEDSGIPFTVLRPNFFMQNFVDLHGHTIKNNSAFYLPVEDARVSYVDVSDIARVAARLLTMNKNNENSNKYYNGKAYNITGPQALSYREIAGILSSVIGRKISYINISQDQSRKRMKNMGVNDWFINTAIELYDFCKGGHLSAVSSAVEEITGEKPISFWQFAQGHAEAFK